MRGQLLLAGVSFVSGAVERPPRIALLGEEATGLPPRPYRACLLGLLYPGLRFAAPWATILRRFAAEWLTDSRLTDSRLTDSRRGLVKSRVLALGVCPTERKSPIFCPHLGSANTSTTTCWGRIFLWDRLLARISHHLTVEAGNRPASTSLRFLAVLNGLSEYACARQAARASY